MKNIKVWRTDFEEIGREDNVVTLQLRDGLTNAERFKVLGLIEGVYGYHNIVGTRKVNNQLYQLKLSDAAN